MNKGFYSIWKISKNDKEATLLDDEPFYKTKFVAFRRAKALAKDLIYDRGDVILVRKCRIFEDGTIDEDCIEWDFPATPY